MKFRVNHLVWVVMIVVSLYVTYQVKYRVQDIEKNIAATQRQIASEQDSIHVLDAEWSYLNRPERLYRLSTEYKGLQKVGVHQIVAVDTLPMVVPAGGAIPAPTPDISTPEITAPGTSAPAETMAQIPVPSRQGSVVPVGWSPTQGGLKK